ncbi:MAG: hypothetical protein NTW05_28240 [Pseudonocardiales bacterium]|nr:hypothetical protein [Pseudonocardiales bacterium]
MGKRIAHYRGLRGFKTTAQLSKRCEELGHRIPPQVIANMESGRRGNVPSAELAVLAAALEVPVYLLCIPLGSPEPVEVLPGKSVSAWTAYRLYADGVAWSSIVGGFPTSADRERGADLLEGEDLVTVYRSHDDLLVAFVGWRNAASESPGNHSLSRRADDSLRGLVEVRDKIRRRGWALPDLLPEVDVEVSTAEKLARDAPFRQLNEGGPS